MRRRSWNGRPRLIAERASTLVKIFDELRVVFQPVVHLATGAVVGHEALARFGSGRNPEAVIAEATAAGTGLELELAAVRRAIADYDKVPYGGFLAVNASPQVFISPRLLELMKEVPSPDRIVIELTEHEPVTNYDALRAARDRLHALGVKVAVDDTGAGTASLQHVLAIEPDIIKLDRSLIVDLDNDAARFALAQAFATFGTAIGASVIAEGVERVGEVTACHAAGVPFAQGFVLGRPFSAETLAANEIRTQANGFE